MAAPRSSATSPSERWIVQIDDYDESGRVYLKLADATPRRSRARMMLLTKLVERAGPQPFDAIGQFGRAEQLEEVWTSCDSLEQPDLTKMGSGAHAVMRHILVKFRLSFRA